MESSVQNQEILSELESKMKKLERLKKKVRGSIKMSIFWGWTSEYMIVYELKPGALLYLEFASKFCELGD